MLIKVIAAAIVDEDMRLWCLPAPAKHADLLAYMKTCGKNEDASWIEGFKLSNNLFADRREAMFVAKAANQVKPRLVGQYQGPELFSEDLW